MKLEEEYPNFKTALLTDLSYEDLISGSNDRKMLSYYVQLVYPRKALDFYELKRHRNGGVFFTMATMSGLRIVVSTESSTVEGDLSVGDWSRKISEIIGYHIKKKEYLEFRTQPSQQASGHSKNTGCVALILLMVVSTIISLFV